MEARGVLSGDAAAQIGLAPGTILVAGGGDDPAAALGPGWSGRRRQHRHRIVDELADGRRRATFDATGVIGLMPHLAPGRYLHEMVSHGNGNHSALAPRRLRRRHGATATSSGTAGEIPRGSEGLLCFPYVEGATVPVQDDQARAVYYGISGHHRRAHFSRAILEGIAYQYPALLDVVRDRGHTVKAMTISDGEARSRQWNQIKADVLGESITPSLRVEAPAIGAAILAGVGGGTCCGPWKTAWPSCWNWPRPCTPTRTSTGEYTALRQHWQAVRDSVFPSLARRPCGARAMSSTPPCRTPSAPRRSSTASSPTLSTTPRSTASRRPPGP